MNAFEEDDPPLELFGPEGYEEPPAPPEGGFEPTPVGREGLSLPHAIDSEREVLAAVFVDPTSMDTLIEHLHPGDFYLERHQLIFESMQRLYERQGTVDMITLQQELKDFGVFEKAGGAQALVDLLDRAGTTSNLPHYCQIVRKKAIVRQMIGAAQSIEAEGFQDIGDVAEFLDRAETQVFAVLEERQGQRVRPISDVVRDAIGQVEAAYNSEGSVTGLGTGFRDLDKLTHGLQAGDLIIVAGRPAMGKTSFCLNLATNAALRNGGAVAFFSLEMPAEQLALRILASEARIDVSRLRGGFLTDDDWPRLVKAADGLSKARLFIDDSPVMTASSMRATSRRLARKYGLDLVIVDYLQLMTSSERGRSREQEISQLSRSMKALAKDLSLPVIALSQLNRGVESRTDKRPLMADLRESGAIEQDADIIGFIYRDEVYNKKIEDDERGIAELIIGKHRNGPTGTVKLKFWNAYTRFDNLAQGY